MFQIVTFPNAECTATTGDTGTCVTRAECQDRGGAVSGSCALGFGACCLVIHTTCGGSLPHNCTYLRWPCSLVFFHFYGFCGFIIHMCTFLQNENGINFLLIFWQHKKVIIGLDINLH